MYKPLSSRRQSELLKLWLIPQDGRTQVMAFDAIAFNGKRLVVGEGIGTYTHQTEVCGMVMDILNKFTQPDKPMVCVTISDVASAKRRILEGIDLTPEGGCVMFLCASPDVIDAMLPYLAIQAPGTAVNW